jgi:hypothetical protein
MEQFVADVPGCIDYAYEEFRLESLNYYLLCEIINNLVFFGGGDVKFITTFNKGHES